LRISQHPCRPNRDLISAMAFWTMLLVPSLSAHSLIALPMKKLLIITSKTLGHSLQLKMSLKFENLDESPK
jgi:hypothetical protein